LGPLFGELLSDTLEKFLGVWADHSVAGGDKGNKVSTLIHARTLVLSILALFIVVEELKSVGVEIRLRI